MKLRRKIAFLLICSLGLCFLLAGCSKDGSKETTEPDTSGFAVDFYKITDESKSLSIELDADPASGYNWTYEISDESILNLTSFSFNPGEENGKGAVWSASFAASSTKGGHVQLSLYSVRNLEDVEQTQPTYVLSLDVSVDGKLTVKSIKR